MPIYEFSCTKCSHVVSKIVQLNSANEEEFAYIEPCPNCGNSTFQKIISASSFVLKGGGWFKDGYTKK